MNKIKIIKWICRETREITLEATTSQKLRIFMQMVGKDNLRIICTLSKMDKFKELSFWDKRSCMMLMVSYSKNQLEVKFLDLWLLKKLAKLSRMKSTTGVSIVETISLLLSKRWMMKDKNWSKLNSQMEDCH